MSDVSESGLLPIQTIAVNSDKALSEIGGIRIEDNILVTSTGARVLASFEISLYLMD